MSFTYSERSLVVRATVHPELQAVFDKVLEERDHTYLGGVRFLDEQLENLRTNRSRTPNTRHFPGGGLRRTSTGGIALPTESWLLAIEQNDVEYIDPNGPSEAVDISPYPINWNDEEGMRDFGAFVRGVAHAMGVDLRWGGDWDGDYDYDDQTFNDLVHFERRRRP